LAKTQKTQKKKKKQSKNHGDIFQTRFQDQPAWFQKIRGVGGGEGKKNKFKPKFQKTTSLVLEKILACFSKKTLAFQKWGTFSLSQTPLSTGGFF